jgi:hypothetical protein
LLARGAGGAGLVQEPVDAPPGEALAPAADPVVIKPELAADRRVALPFTSKLNGQHHGGGSIH